MTERNEDKTRRIAIELDRLDQEVRTLQRLLDESGLDHPGEMSRRLRYLATSAERVAGLVERTGSAGSGE
ncbi:hypothetical protein IGS68_29080 (plasmid) [Skermanella sp. TT6]|uniref:Uncharacterized protein n=1 Tax=Skermanella cutis TaxID=2775420 RepID=A0ABX7BFM1_9PROT|nr:hypothetical protein [Skermanella sp. TT6]QQP93187.1 hypothetical protein IGS68_29080 [Skermanella sp. TT6]